MNTILLSSPSSSHIRSMVCGLPFQKRKQRYLAMLRAYFDDSGSDSLSPFYLLAGFVATVPAWETFSDEWDAALNIDPKIGYVKAREANSRHGEFHRWDEDTRNQRLAVFGEIIRKHVIAGCGVAVSKTSYERFTRGNVYPQFDNPYFVCFCGVIPLLFMYMDDLGFADQKIDFVFDEQTIEKRARPLFDSFKSLPWKHAERLGSLDFRCDKEVVPLQAADMIAWMARRQLKQIAQDNTREIKMGPHPQVIINVLQDYDLERMRENARKAWENRIQ